MAQIRRALYAGLTLHLIFAAAVHRAAAEFLSISAPPQTTAAPHKGPVIPAQGLYSVKNDNGTVCLKAAMSLQINISFPSASSNTTVPTVMNLNPNETLSAGSCHNKSATLILSSANKTELNFTFSLNTTSHKYHVSSVSISAAWPDMIGTFSAHNDSLDYLRGSLGFSYMCQSEQVLKVSHNFSLNTFLLHVQPFGLNGDKFSPAQACLLDEDDLMIPIVVGAALAVLVLIVLMAYLIGRKRSHAGYQTI